jgi:hypothetical protein
MDSTYQAIVWNNVTSPAHQAWPLKDIWVPLIQQYSEQEELASVWMVGQMKWLGLALGPLGVYF